jgi:hypothetical protein
MRNPVWAVLLILSLGSAAWAETPQSAVAPTEVAADLGPCSALITVLGSDGKPVYNAKIATRIRYGMLGAKRLDIEVYTSAAGQAKINGLPDSTKKPLIFDIGKGGQGATLEYQPAAECRANLKAQLR